MTAKWLPHNTWQRILKRIREIVRFGFNGTFCFIIDYGVLILLTEVFDIYYLWSAAISFTLSTLVNYLICVFWVFEGVSGQNRRTKIIFVVVSLIGLGLNQLLLCFMVDVLNFFYMLAKVIATGIVMIWNYFTKRKAIFTN